MTMPAGRPHRAFRANLDLESDDGPELARRFREIAESLERGELGDLDRLGVAVDYHDAAPTSTYRLTVRHEEISSEQYRRQMGRWIRSAEL